MGVAGPVGGMDWTPTLCRRFLIRVFLSRFAFGAIARRRATSGGIAVGHGGGRTGGGHGLDPHPHAVETAPPRPASKVAFDNRAGTGTGTKSLSENIRRDYKVFGA